MTNREHKAKFVNMLIFNLLLFSLCFSYIARGAEVPEKQFYTKYNYAIGLGLGLDYILNNNAATKTFYSGNTQDPNAPAIWGGGFYGNQPGISLRFQANVDEKGNFIVPIGFDYIQYDGRQKGSASGTAIIYYKHTVDVWGLNFGLNWVFKRFPFADAKLYAGADGRVSLYLNETYTRKGVSNDNEVLINTTDHAKADAKRLGLFAKTGMSGYLYENMYVNTWVSFGSPNLFLTDDSRGELLTPYKSVLQGTYYETKEHILPVLSFNFQIMYCF